MTQLNKEQQTAVRHQDGPMLVIAGPGSGKTAVLTEHIRYLITEADVRPEQILALTFSKKAAGDMQRRFLKNTGQCSTGVTFGTFHSVFYGVLRQYNSQTLRIVTVSEQITMMKDLIRRKEQKIIDSEGAMYILNKISLYKNTGSLPFLPAMTREDFLWITREYDRRMENAGCIDYEDMILKALQILKNQPLILTGLQDRFLHILTDEFQDCNTAQYDLLNLLAGKRANLFAVGDDDQSIYGFRGAGGDVMQRLLADHRDCKIVYLRRNYRCPASVIDLADRFARGNQNRLEKPKQLPSKRRGEGSVVIMKNKDAYAEAVSVYKEIVRLLGNGECLKNDIAILYRSEQCADYLTEYLAGQDLVCVRSAKNSFYAMPGVQEALAYLSLSQGQYTRTAFYTVLNHPNRNLVRECIGDEKVLPGQMLCYYEGDQRATQALNKLFSDLKYIRDLPPFAALHYIFRGIGLGQDYDPDVLLPKLCARAKPYSTIRDFLQHVREEKIPEEQQGKNKQIKDGITLQTVHASKGLEYDTVFVIGLQEGLFPSARACTVKETEEERRLMYVAMTRARNRLYLCARGCENIGKRYSPFIAELER